MTEERQVAGTVLQEDDKQITVGGHTYTYGKPTVATMIMVSALVSELPVLNHSARGADIVREVLRTAKDLGKLGEIASVLILGAKRVKEHRQISAGKAFPAPWWAFWRKNDKPIMLEEKDALAENLIDELSVDELQNLIIGRISDLHVGGFFGLTTSLTTANILKPTRSGVEERTTASGQ